MTAPRTELLAAPHTPMRGDGSVNLDAVDRQVALLRGAGLQGAFICGTTAESLSLTLAERRAIAERWRRAAGDDFRLIAHVGGTCLADCRELAAHARDVGADAIGVMGPCFFKPRTAEQLAEFCAGVADAAPGTPLYYYHIPSITGVDVRLYDFLLAARRRIETLAGAKFTHEDLMDYARCAALDPERLRIYFGRDEFLLAGLALGAPGGIGSTYNFAGPLYRRIADHYEAGDLPSARADQLRAAEMMAVLQRFGTLAAGKAVMKMIGLDCGPVRPPLANLSAERLARLRAELERTGFFDFAMRA